ncbi:ATP-binding cassette domain-containing protein [Bacteroidota bacterium]
MKKETIQIINAHTNNLKNLNIEIPKQKLVVFTGVSGSGKSSLVFDTVYTEAQRQLIETFSTFARARMPKLSRPDVEDIHNLSTAIVIDQKRMGKNLRSTVGTATEIITYLRLLYSRFAKPFIGPSFLFSFNHPDGMCPVCHGLGKKISIDLDLLLDKEKSIREGAVIHPEFKVGGWMWREVMAVQIVDVDKKLKDFTEEEMHILLYTEPIPIEKKHGAGIYAKNHEGFARRLERRVTERAEAEEVEDEKNIYKKYLVYSDCKACNGTRLNERALSIKINGMSIGDICELELTDLATFLEKIDEEKAKPVLRKAQYLLDHLIEIGVGYLTLSRPVSTLSGGESQRVKMARQLDCNLVDLMYIMDEPSIGLHPRDTDKLMKILHKIKDHGNSVFVVEHDPEIIKEAEWIIDIGPKAGIEGGNLVYSGELEGLKNTSSITGKYLYNNHKTKYERKKPVDFIKLENISVHNLKNVSVSIPRGVLTCITGVAGSGKSSLINHYFVKNHPGAIVIDQSPVGKSSRGNPATYTGAFTQIREKFAKENNVKPALFSFNSEGACPKCNGQGFVSMELHFLDAVKTVCDECDGSRYKAEVLKYTYNDKNIAEVLNMSANQIVGFFDNEKIDRRFKALQEVGLGYLKIGQSLSSLSGGEAQRLKLASQLHKKSNIYIMDEPTTGLHMADIEKLFQIIKSLVQKNNTVIIIEHNLDIIKNADWIIDMGPEGGKKGGQVLFEGTPEDLINCNKSFTGKYLKKVI